MPETDAANLREIAALIREGRDHGTSLSMAKAVVKLGELPDAVRRQAIEAQSLVRRAMKSGSRLELERALTEVEQMLATKEKKPAEKAKPKRASNKAKRTRKKARRSTNRRD